jgi:putative transposase
MSKTISIRERKHRLPDELYRGMIVGAFTLCIKDRFAAFTSNDIYRTLEEILVSVLQKYQCSADVYLFMPDHCHLLLRGTGEDSDVLKTVKMFKQQSGYWFSKHQPEIRWQKDFYDHIVRRNEDVLKQVRYILNNPLRAGLVDDWKAYPFVGSTVHTFKEW